MIVHLCFVSRPPLSLHSPSRPTMAPIPIKWRPPPCLTLTEGWFMSHGRSIAWGPSRRTHAFAPLVLYGKCIGGLPGFFRALFRRGQIFETGRTRRSTHTVGLLVRVGHGPRSRVGLSYLGIICARATGRG